jgi:hypothetical protein
MARFKVLQNFRIEPDVQTTVLTPGGIYVAGDEISGLNAAEASELLRLAPDGTFEAVDEEAQTIATRVLNLSGNVGMSGSTEVK